MSNLMFGTKFVEKITAAFRSNFCRISFIKFDAAVIWLNKASIRFLNLSLERLQDMS